MTSGELARQAGTTAEQVERLVALGIVQPADEGVFRPPDIHRVRLAQALENAGVSLQDIGCAISAGQLSFRFIEGVFPRRPPPVLDRTFAEAAAEAGVALDVLSELYTNYGLPPPQPQQPVREDDARLIAGRGQILQVVRDPETLIAASRYFGDNLRRAAESQVRFFRARVIDPLLAGGTPPGGVLDAIAPLSAALQRSADELVPLLYERHLETYALQEAVELIEAALDAAGLGERRKRDLPAIAFLDISGYTRLTEQSGDEAAAEFATRLGALVRRASSAYGGHAVKFLGDGVMFHFPEPPRAVACALELVPATEKEGLPAARVGINVGPVVFHEGDYFGRTVNVAARIVDYARPREVLVSQEVARVAADGSVAFDPIGPVALKGLLEPIPLFRAVVPRPEK